MRKRTGERRSTAVNRYSTRKAIVRGILAGAAFAGVVLACAWTVLARLDVPQVGVAQVPPAEPPAAEEPALVYVDTDLIYSSAPLGVPRTFAQTRPLASTFRFAARPAQHAEAQPKQPAAQPAVKLVQSVAMPKPRPAELKLPQIAATSLRAKVDHTASHRERVLAALKMLSQPSTFQKFFGRREDSESALGYAPTDGGVLNEGRSRLLSDDQATAIYDISARTVYMPDGTKLEAHSGLGNMLDDPDHVRVRMRGATPPHVYDLKMREALFHGVEAIRLTPVGGEGEIFGRTGLLAHTYMLGPNGDSNGCVSFKNYEAFLRAYKRNEVKRLVVVGRMG